MLRLKGDPQEREFLNQVIEKSGQNLLECLQCGKCSGSCPIISETVRGPRGLISQILIGMKDEALKDPTWWYCVSCGTCANRCPVEINMYQVANTLCEMAENSGIKPAEPEIHLFETLFMSSVEKSGRARELYTVMKYNLRTFQPFKDALAGMNLIFKGAVHPQDILPRIKTDSRVARIFKRVEQMRQGE